MTSIYWLGFLFYSVLVVGIGWWVWWREKRQGKVDDTQTYWAASRNLGWVSVGLSISASMMSISWSCVYGVQLFYWYGVGAAWLLIIPWLLTMLGFWVLTPVFRKLQAFSQPELLGQRFGPRARQLLAPTLMVVFTVWGGAEIYAAGLTIAPFLNVEVPTALVLIAIVVGLYSFTGGFEAVVSTDKIQFALVAFFITAMAWIGGHTVIESQGWQALWQAQQLAPRAETAVPAVFSPGVAIILLTLFAYLPGWLVETDVWIRVQAARSTREARRGIVLAGVNAFIFVGILPLIIGLAALVLYPPVNGVIPERLQDGAFIFGALMADFTPVWLNLLLGIGLLAASMSTVDTCANVVALSFSYDLVEPGVRRKWPPHRLATMARWASVGAIGLALIYALFTESLWDIFYLSSGLLTTTVFIPVIAAFRKEVHAHQVYAALISGLVATILFYFLEKNGWLASLQPAWMAETGLGYIVYAFLVAAMAFWVARFSVPSIK